MAKIASDLRKPDGLVVVPVGEEATFLAPLPIGRLWGVGEKTAVGARASTASGRSATSPRCRRTSLVRRFGKHGASLVDRARGIDADPVHDGDPAKSVGHEHTFDVDTSDPEVIERTLLAMADGVAGRLRSAGVRAGTVAVKIRDSGFRTITRQRTLAEPTDLTDPIYATALELARPEIRGMRVRLLGVTASNLGEREQLGPVRDGRAAPATGGRGGRRAPPAVRRAGGHAGPAARGRAAGAVRARPAEPARSAGAGRPGRARRAGRDGRCRVVTRKVTRTLDDIPPDDA